MYDEYMQNFLREDYFPYQYTYEPMVRNTNYYNQMDDYNNFNCDYPYNYVQKNVSKSIVTDIEKLYPDIYKIIYPMIKKAVSQNAQSITEDVLDEITNDIYNNIESANSINLNIDITNNRNENKSISNTKNTISDNKENRDINNSVRDLIKILLIRELIDTNNFHRHPKSYFPGHIPFLPNPSVPRHHSNISMAKY